MIKVGIIGSTGYAGEQLVNIIKKHPYAELGFIASHNYAGIPFSSIYKNYTGIVDDLCIGTDEAEKMIPEVDILFLALPSGKSFGYADIAVKAGVKVIDLSADFRIKDAEEYQNWYKVQHGAAELLKKAVYGLPELKDIADIQSARIIANPGCYPTATLLGLAPLLKNKLIDSSTIIVDAKSGLSGAGRSAEINNLYTETAESLHAYAAPNHRHTPEIEQLIGELSGNSTKITFTPHIVPMIRGILSTCYASLNGSMETDELIMLYKEFYKNKYFVKVIDGYPETRWVKNSNMCHISLRADKRTGRVTVYSVIDNMIKGAAGQAVQNMNIMFGFDEKSGIDFITMAP